MIEPTFEVYLSGYLLDIPFFLGIVTACSTPDGESATEYFYLRHAEDKKTWRGGAMRITADPKSFEFAKNAEDFWQAETVPQMKNAIYHNEVLPLIDKTGTPYHMVPVFNMHRVTKATLFPMSTVFQGMIERIGRMSQCKALKEYAKLVHDSSPLIQTQDIEFSQTS